MSTTAEGAAPNQPSATFQPNPSTQAPTAAPAAAPVTLPPWASSDWLQAAASAVAVLATVIGVSYIVSILGALLLGEFDEVPIFQSGFMTAAAALGSDIGLQGGNGSFAAGSIALSMVAIPLVLVPFAAARFVCDRLAVTVAHDGIRLRAFAAKVALLCALGSIGICAVASISFTVADRQYEAPYFGQYSTTPVKAFFITLFSVGCGALLTRLRLRSSPGRVRNLLAAPVKLAVQAYCISAAIVLTAAFVYGVIDSDLDGRGFLWVIYAGAIAGGTWALYVVTFGMGIPVEVRSSTFDDDWVSESTHLLSSGVPWWMKLFLLVVPLVMALVMWRHLETAGPKDAREVSRIATLTAVCFAAITFFGAVLFRGSIEATGDLPWDVDVYVYEEISFNIGLAVVLSLVWGFVGVFLAAIPWSSQRGVPLIVTSPSAKGTPPATALSAESAALAPQAPPLGPTSSSGDTERLSANIPAPDPSKRAE
jgi:hypothetical protein